jgi:hypothetical protein
MLFQGTSLYTYRITGHRAIIVCNADAPNGSGKTESILDIYHDLDHIRLSQTGSSIQCRERLNHHVPLSAMLYHSPRLRSNAW